ncbi:hypothetical protein FHL15_008645 [Xylaria flabelliformis]|uniref:Pectinesterase n=1 Tax=Xylaria flabelliformis TaxID=2512241 RepID=A0A553HR94_9PEZI|nr:hypothetical protein FHL15_008645 [Xylaria flabelliformis]
MKFQLTSLLLTAFGASTCLGATTLVKRASRTSAPSGCLSVKPGTTTSGWYQTLTAALNSLSGTSSACIFLYSGTYNEQVVIQYGGPLTIYGYTTNSTVQVKSNKFSMYNINVVNGYGAGAQAVALTANGNQQGYYGCIVKDENEMSDNPDSLYAKAGDQYYSNCYIAGATDYIFGKAAAWFGECTIASKAGGAITANSREETSDTTWYVIDHSTITSVSGTSLSGKVYLGRPWRVLARVIYQYNTLTSVVAAAGWTTLADNATPIFQEYQNTGDGSSTSSRVYETATSTAVTKSVLWPNGYSWIDTSY